MPTEFRVLSVRDATLRDPKIKYTAGYTKWAIQNHHVVEFTHCQGFETFVRCHIHAFHYLRGVARELWYDNLATAVAEHDGNMVRFHPRSLAFAREYSFLPRACHIRAAWEKGKIERSIAYLRQSFWPLRSFTDLADVNLQVRQWLEEVAHQWRHRETNQSPQRRFQPETLRAVPAITPDYATLPKL